MTCTKGCWPTEVDINRSGTHICMYRGRTQTVSMPSNPPKRFDSRKYTLDHVVEARRGARLPNGCELFQGRPNTGGYPQINHAGKMTLATRFVLERKLGRPLRAGYLALHKCHTPMCIREDHLYEGTDLQNMKDRRERNGYRDVSRGTDHARAIFTEDQVRAIRQESGTHAAIARKYDVSSGAVWGIKTGRTWRHVL